MQPIMRCYEGKDLHLTCQPFLRHYVVMRYCSYKPRQTFAQHDCLFGLLHCLSTLQVLLPLRIFQGVSTSSLGSRTLLRLGR